MTIKIRKFANGMYMAGALTEISANRYLSVTANGVSPRQALARLAAKCNLHGQTVTVSVEAPDKAIAPLRNMAVSA